MKISQTTVSQSNNQFQYAKVYKKQLVLHKSLQHSKFLNNLLAGLSLDF